MIEATLAIMSVAALLLLYRLFTGPTVADRVIALDALLATVTCGVLVGAGRQGTPLSIDTVLVVALAGFVASAALGRYIEERGE